MDILQGEQNNAVQLSGKSLGVHVGSRRNFYFLLTPLFPIAGVYLKNRITRGWAPVEDSPQRTPIPEAEKPSFRERLIPALASTPPNVRNQLVPLLQKILQNDFPEQWPGFLDLTLQLLGTNDASTVYAGLQCLLAVCRVYRFKAGEKREEFDKIVEHSFPQLLSIGSKLVDEESLEAAEMLRIVVKAFKHAIYVGYPDSSLRMIKPFILTGCGFSLSFPHAYRPTRQLWTGVHYSFALSRRHPLRAQWQTRRRSGR